MEEIYSILGIRRWRMKGNTLRPYTLSRLPEKVSRGESGAVTMSRIEEVIQGWIVIARAV
jgi:hypothetical protein